MQLDLGNEPTWRLTYVMCMEYMHEMKINLSHFSQKPIKNLSKTPLKQLFSDPPSIFSNQNIA